MICQPTYLEKMGGIEHLNDATVAGLSNCCNAKIYAPDICSECQEHCGSLNDCLLCGGEGRIEKEEYTCDESTGYNTIVEGTGKYYKCPECNPEDHESDE